MTVRNRIVRGYILVLGLAVTGSTAGLLLGGHLQKRAIALQEIAIAERKLISDLQIKILYNRPTKQLSPYLSDPAQFEAASQALLDRVSSIQQLILDHESVHASEPAGHHDQNTASEQEALHHELDGYNTALKEFSGPRRSQQPSALNQSAGSTGQTAIDPARPKKCRPRNRARPAKPAANEARPSRKNV